MRTLWQLFLALTVIATTLPDARATRIGIRDGRWLINDRPTNAGSAAEGLLMNVRMVNVTFEDRGKPGFDPAANTERFISRIGDYVAHGVNAFTLCLQGGMPGYEGAMNSAFEPDGSLRPAYLARVERVIRACDRHGVAVILGLFYQRQSRILKDEEAVRTGVVNAVRWVRERGFQNVLIEIANEYPHKGFAHPIIRAPKGQASLIRLAKQTAPGLLVTASGYGDGKVHAEVAEACDFLTPHWNGTKVEDIPARVAALQRFGKPIVCNEDDKTGAKAVAAMQASIANGAGYGLMLKKHNQTFPFHFDGAADDPLYYAALKKITSERVASMTGDYFPPPDNEGGWRTRSGDLRFDAAFEFAKRTTKNGGLLVLHRGWLVYERYFGHAHHEANPVNASIGKSFTSIAVGILMRERADLFPDGLDQKVFTPRYFPAEMFPLSDPRKANIKLGQLLSMTAGIRGNNPGSMVDHQPVTLDPAGPDGQVASTDAMAFGQADGKLNARTLWCEPGGGYSYATASIHLGSVMLRHVTGRELKDYVEEKIARPLGWDRWDWRDPNNPHTPGGGNIAPRPTDMLRFGYLLLREGRWRNRQLVPADYVRHCAHPSSYNPHYDYSLQFDVNGNGHWPDVPRDAFWKSGSGGHVLYVVPSLDLVVYKMGGRDSQYARSRPAPTPDLSRENWKEDRTLDYETSKRETLKLVLAALR